MTTTLDAIEETYLVLATVAYENLLVRRNVLTRPHKHSGIQSYFSCVCQLSVPVLCTACVVDGMRLVSHTNPVYWCRVHQAPAASLRDWDSVPSPTIAPHATVYNS